MIRIALGASRSLNPLNTFYGICALVRYNADNRLRGRRHTSIPPNFELILCTNQNIVLRLSLE